MKFVSSFAVPALFIASQAFGFTEEMYSILPVTRDDASGYTLGLNHTFLPKLLKTTTSQKICPKKNSACVEQTWASHGIGIL